MAKSEQERRLEMQQAFEKQLHEQYAINNNSNWSSIVSLFAAIVAVFYGFGYIFVNSSVHFASSFEKLYCSCTKIYSLDVFLFTTISTIIVIGIMRYICLYQGYHQRYEQFIIYALRFQYYNKAPEEVTPRIFPHGYSPFKTKQYIDSEGEECLIQGLFGELFKILGLFYYIIWGAVLIKLFFNIKYSNNIPNCRGVFEFYILLLIFVYVYAEISSQKIKLKKKYDKLIEEYKKYNIYNYETS